MCARVCLWRACFVSWRAPHMRGARESVMCRVRGGGVGALNQELAYRQSGNCARLGRAEPAELRSVERRQL